jgi:GNAT superfamily N-acetyltransferase
MEISPLQNTEIQEAVDLACLCFSEGYRPYAMEDFSASFETASSKPKTFVAKKDGKLIGLVQSFPGYIHPNIRSLAWLCTHPDYRRQGIAAKLLAYAEQDTIDTVFHGKDGSFLLVSATNPDYYRTLGYDGDLKTYDGLPFMVKHYKA